MYFFLKFRTYRRLEIITTTPTLSIARLKSSADVQQIHSLKLRSQEILLLPYIVGNLIMPKPVSYQMVRKVIPEVDSKKMSIG